MRKTKNIFFYKKLAILLVVLWLPIVVFAQRDLAKELLELESFDSGWQKVILLLSDSLSKQDTSAYFEGGVLKVGEPRFKISYDTLQAVDVPKNKRTYWMEDSLIKSFTIRVTGNCSQHYELKMVKHASVEYFVFEKDSLTILRTKQYEGTDYEWLPLEVWDSLLQIPDGCDVWRWNENVLEDSEGNLYTVFPAGYYSKWLGSTICCGSYLYPSQMIADIQNALRKEGYELEPSEVLDTQTKAALSHFQKKNGLPMGQLNRETLCMLGIRL